MNERRRSINLSVDLVFDLEAGRFKFLGENLLALQISGLKSARSLRSILQVEWLIATLFLFVLAYRSQ